MADSVSAEMRTAYLNAEISKLVSKGYEVQVISGYSAVLSKKKKIRLFFHLIIALLTFGIWLIVPLWQFVNRKNDSVTVEIDEQGRVRRY